jgi:2-dehydro-3-deoxygalactonokinase
MILAVDSGTTRTRVWVLADGGVAAGASAVAGARDLARNRDKQWLLGRVRLVAEETLAAASLSWAEVEAVVGFGMITSELGLVELPHLIAPVGAAELAAAMYEPSGAAALPARLLLVPGVRNVSESIEHADFMRGEETEVVGLLTLDRIKPPLLYVSIGSHPKFVWVDAGGRIAWSLTTLSGELIWALQQETILAELIDPSAELVDFEAVDEGARVVETAGLSRALFVARVLSRTGGASRETCSAFVHGAVARADLRALEAPLPVEAAPERIVLSGQGPLLDAYRHLLERSLGSEPQVLDQPLGAIGAGVIYEFRAALDRSEEGRKLRA